MRLTWQEIAEAAGGKILLGAPEKEVSGYAQDSRLVQPGDLFFPIIGPNRDGHDFLEDVAAKGCRSFLISHPEALERLQAAVADAQEAGDGLAVILVDNTEQALEDLARYALRKIGCRIVGVTGSTGKTSTRDMTACVMAGRYKTGVTKGNFNTPIGMSLTILGFDEDTEVGVLEMGMDHFGEIKHLVSIASPEAALITNIGISHMENLGSRDGIFRAKMEITSAMTGGQTLLVSESEDYLNAARIGRDYGTDRFRLAVTGTGETCALRIDNIEENGIDGIAFDLVQAADMPAAGEAAVTAEKRVRCTLPVPGRHNALDAALAAGAGLAFGIPLEESVRSLASLTLTGGRLTVVRAGDYRLIDDAYNASPDSVRAALDVLAAVPDGHKYAVLGDMLELGTGEAEEHYRIGVYAKEKHLDGVFTFGALSEHTARGAGEEARHFADKQQLAEALYRTIRPGDVILFKASHSMGADTVLADIRSRVIKVEETADKQEQ